MYTVRDPYQQLSRFLSEPRKTNAEIELTKLALVQEQC